jgi:hypothetical protein
LERDNINALCWEIYFVNDTKEVNVIALQIMQCILCHNNPILNKNPKTQAKQGLIIYDSFNHIIALRKHANSNHLNIFKNLKKNLIVL